MFAGSADEKLKAFHGNHPHNSSASITLILKAKHLFGMAAPHGEREHKLLLIQRLSRAQQQPEPWELEGQGDFLKLMAPNLQPRRLDSSTPQQ